MNIMRIHNNRKEFFSEYIERVKAQTKPVRKVERVDIILKIFIYL